MVFVDPLRDFGWNLGPNCHLTAEGPMCDDELHAFAQKIGMNRSWFRPWPKASISHYDLTSKRRDEAVKLGAVELDRRGARKHFKDWHRHRRDAEKAKLGSATEKEIL